jgi:hypothetical protein
MSLLLCSVWANELLAGGAREAIARFLLLCAPITPMRPVMKMEDGSYVTMLMPAHILLFRWLGQLSLLVPVGLVVAFSLSFWRVAFARAATLLCVAIFQCMFATIYAILRIMVTCEWLAGHLSALRQSAANRV